MRDIFYSYLFQIYVCVSVRAALTITDVLKIFWEILFLFTFHRNEIKTTKTTHKKPKKIKLTRKHGGRRKTQREYFFDNLRELFTHLRETLL